MKFQELKSYIICHPTHKFRSQFMKHGLQINNLAIRYKFKLRHTFPEILWKRHIGKNLHIRNIQEVQSSLPLNFPEFPVSIDNAITKQIPGSSFEEVSFGKNPLIFQNILKVPRIIYHYPGGQGWNRNLKCLEAKYPFALDEPRE